MTTLGIITARFADVNTFRALQDDLVKLDIGVGSKSREGWAAGAQLTH